METVIYGNEIKFRKSFIDSSGAYVDPPEVKFSIVKNVISILYGPYSYDNAATPSSSNEGFIRVGQGVYEVTQLIESFIVPGVYAAKWEGEVDGVDQVSYENFQVIEETIQPARIIDPTSLKGRILEKPLYNELGLGSTDRILLIGHADGLEINAPHRVINIQETINLLGADLESPLLRGMLEVYNAGARDIWVVAAAPMYEYVPFDYANASARLTQRADLGGLNFYQKYAQRLDETYNILRMEDFPEIIVPLEAPFYDAGDVDFLTPLLFNCLQRYRETGAISIGLIGTRIPFENTNIVNDLTTDIRISRLENDEYIFSTKMLFTLLKYHYGINLFSSYTQDNILDGQDLGKFGMVVVGEGLYNNPQVGGPYAGSLVTSVAALLATRPVNQSIVYKKSPRVSNLVGHKFTKDEIKQLADKRINVATLTPLGKRGTQYEVVVATDNTLANGWPDNALDDQSAFWSISTLRLIGKISQRIVALGNVSLGTIQYAQFKVSVNDLLSGMVSRGFIRDYSLNIFRLNDENRTVYVDLAIYPYFTIREIYFSVKVGPGTGE